MGTQTWKETPLDDRLPGDSVRQIRVIDGKVWVATAAGVAVLQNGRVQQVYTAGNSGLPSQFVHAIGTDESSTIWMATSGGLASFDGRSWRSWPADEINAGPMGNHLVSLRQDPGGSLWLADFFGSVCEFIPGWNHCRQVILPPDRFNSTDAFDIDGRGRMAIGSITDGLWLYSEGEWTALRTRDQPLSNAFLAMAATPDGQVWLAGRDGLQRFQASRPAAPWMTFPLPDNATPHSFFVGSDGLWIGYTGGARFVPHLKGREVVDIPLQDQDPGVDNTVTAINRDDEGRLYFGLGTGLIIWNGTSLQFEDLRSDAERQAGQAAPRVNSLYFDSASMWVGASNGLYRFRNGRLAETWAEKLQEVSSYYASSVGAIMPCPRGEQLLAGIGRELFLFDGGRFERVLELPGEIRSMAAGPYQLWLATANSGFYSVPMDDSPTIYWENASRNRELPDRFGYQAICMTDAYTLWVASMESGLVRIPGMFGQ